MEDLQKELGSLEPVGGVEGLGGEVAPAVTTAEPLDAVGCGLPGEEPGAVPAPAGAASAVVGTSFVGTEGRNESGLGIHAEARLHSSRHLQSSEHDLAGDLFWLRAVGGHHPD